MKIPGWRPAGASLSHGQGDSLALVGNPPSDGVTIKTLVGSNCKLQLIFYMMQKMSSTENENNGVNGTGSSSGEGVSLGRSSTVEQRGPGRQQATAQRKWTTQDNVC